MKVITKCVIDIKTLKVVDEESYEYRGSIAELKGSSGGGSAGAVSYPAYIETAHSDLYDHTTADSPTFSMIDTLNAATTAGAPWASEDAYDPDDDINVFEAAVYAFSAILAGVDWTGNWERIFKLVSDEIGIPPSFTLDDMEVDDMEVDDMDTVDGIDPAYIVADVDAHADQIDDEITTKVLPRFRRGMQDIDAVVSSSFTLGEAIIEGFRDRDIAKHSSALRLAAATKNADIELEVARANLSKDLEVAKSNMTKDVEVGKANLTKNTTMNELDLRSWLEYQRLYLSSVDVVMKAMFQRLSAEENNAKLMVEAMRIKIVAKKEETQVNLGIAEKNALWDIELFAYAGNLLAAPAGGTFVPDKASGPSTAQSVLGGALSGAAAGSLVPGVGTVAGGVLGAAMGLLSG